MRNTSFNQFESENFALNILEFKVTQATNFSFKFYLLKRDDNEEKRKKSTFKKEIAFHTV